MKAEIYSRSMLIRRSMKPWMENTGLISIYDSDDVPPKLLFHPKYELYISFDDIYADELDKIDMGSFVAFDDKLAKTICEFISKHKALIDTLVCQCEFGQSRSAAVAAAINEFYNKNGIAIFSCEKYCPNKTVYNLLVKELEKINL